MPFVRIPYPWWLSFIIHANNVSECEEEKFKKRTEDLLLLKKIKKEQTVGVRRKSWNKNCKIQKLKNQYKKSKC